MTSSPGQIDPQDGLHSFKFPNSFCGSDSVAAVNLHDCAFYRRIRTKTQHVAFLLLRSLGFMILLFLGILHSFIFMADVHQSAANLKPLIAEMNPIDLTMQHFAEVASQHTPFVQAALHIKRYTIKGTNTCS